MYLFGCVYLYACMHTPCVCVPGVHASICNCILSSSVYIHIYIYTYVFIQCLNCMLGAIGFGPTQRKLLLYGLVALPRMFVAVVLSVTGAPTVPDRGWLL